MAMRYALHPDPPRASGGRLCFVVMGLDEQTYLRSFDRINLCHPRWSLPAARSHASDLVASRGVEDVLVLCGAKVAAAFGLPSTPFVIYGGCHGRSVHVAGPSRVVLPHPSGLNRAWHQPGAVQQARAVLREVGALPL